MRPSALYEKLITVRSMWGREETFLSHDSNYQRHSCIRENWCEKERRGDEQAIASRAEDQTRKKKSKGRTAYIPHENRGGHVPGKKSSGGPGNRDCQTCRRKIVCPGEKDRHSDPNNYSG